MSADCAAPHRSRRAIFVYYTLAVDKAPRLQQAFAAMASAPMPWQMELMRRTEPGGSSSDPQTWMEIYWLADGDGRDQVLLGQMIEARARDAGVLDLIDGERHCEVFESCA